MNKDGGGQEQIGEVHEKFEKIEAKYGSVEIMSAEKKETIYMK